MPDKFSKLSEKKKWEIADKLSPKLTVENWERYAVAAEMNAKLIARKENDVEQSLSVVRGAVEQKSLIALIQAIAKDYPKDDELKAIIGELQNGYLDKLERLTKMIASDQCILFLGPGVLKINGSENIFNDALSEILRNKLEKATIYFDPTQQDNLAYIVQRFYKIPKTFPGQAGHEAANLYKSYFDSGRINDSVFDKLSNVPWKLVINANPDDILSKMMEKQNPGSVLRRKYTISNNIDERTLTQQVINDMNDVKENKKSFFYNLFGTFEEQHSILYTEADFLEFINSVVNKAPALHSQVTSAFDDKKHYLFLGFDFDQWYFKILVKTLKLYNKEERALSLTGGLKRFSESNLDFFEQEYKFFFVEDDIDPFLTQLVRYYEKETGK